MRETVKAYKGLGMEGSVARWYAKQTYRSLDEFQALARRAADEVPPGSRVLEVAPGPGYFAIALAKLGGYDVAGLDISRTFVEIARRNAAEARASVDFRHGNAAAMPFEDASFDFLLCRAAFKNFSDPVGALREMHRVLKPGGRGLIIDLRRDAPRQAVARAVDRMGLGLWNRTITKLTFRFMLLKRAYTRKEFEEMLRKANVESFEIHEELIGLEVVTAKLHEARVH